MANEGKTGAGNESEDTNSYAGIKEEDIHFFVGNQEKQRKYFELLSKRNAERFSAEPVRKPAQKPDETAQRTTAEPQIPAEPEKIVPPTAEPVLETKPEEKPGATEPSVKPPEETKERFFAPGTEWEPIGGYGKKSLRVYMIGNKNNTEIRLAKDEQYFVEEIFKYNGSYPTFAVIRVGDKKFKNYYAVLIEELLSNLTPKDLPEEEKNNWTNIRKALKNYAVNNVKLYGGPQDLYEEIYGPEPSEEPAARVEQAEEEDEDYVNPEDEKYAEKYWSFYKDKDQIERRKAVLSSVISDAAEEGELRVGVNTKGLTPGNRWELSAIRALARELGYKIGKYKFDPDTSMAIAKIGEMVSVSPEATKIAPKIIEEKIGDAEEAKPLAEAKSKEEQSGKKPEELTPEEIESTFEPGAQWILTGIPAYNVMMWREGEEHKTSVRFLWAGTAHPKYKIVGAFESNPGDKRNITIEYEGKEKKIYFEFKPLDFVKALKPIETLGVKDREERWKIEKKYIEWIQNKLGIKKVEAEEKQPAAATNAAEGGDVKPISVKDAVRGGAYVPEIENEEESGAEVVEAEELEPKSEFIFTYDDGRKLRIEVGSDIWTFGSLTWIIKSIGIAPGGKLGVQFNREDKPSITSERDWAEYFRNAVEFEERASADIEEAEEAPGSADLENNEDAAGSEIVAGAPELATDQVNLPRAVNPALGATAEEPVDKKQNIEGTISSLKIKGLKQDSDQHLESLMEYIGALESYVKDPESQNFEIIKVTAKNIKRDASVELPIPKAKPEAVDELRAELQDLFDKIVERNKTLEEEKRKKNSDPKKPKNDLASAQTGEREATEPLTNYEFDYGDKGKANIGIGQKLKSGETILTVKSIREVLAEEAGEFDVDKDEKILEILFEEDGDDTSDNIKAESYWKDILTIFEGFEKFRGQDKE